MTTTWIYEHEGKKIRYILGEDGKNPVICFGINPSTATPGDLDNTLKSVKRIAEFNGYEGWIMLNVYPLRETYPNKLPQDYFEEKVAINKEKIEEIFRKYPNSDIWCAWGTVVKERDYLKEALKDLLVNIVMKENRKFKCICTTKKGHPKHPLYARKNSTLVDFDIKNYLYIK